MLNNINLYLQLFCTTEFNCDFFFVCFTFLFQLLMISGIYSFFWSTLRCSCSVFTKKKNSQNRQIELTRAPDRVTMNTGVLPFVRTIDFTRNDFHVSTAHANFVKLQRFALSYSISIRRKTFRIFRISLDCKISSWIVRV